MPRRLSRYAPRFQALRKWLRRKNWLDNLARLREWLASDQPRPRWWPVLTFEELEPRWVPAPIQIFYIPMPESDVRVAMTAINSSGASPTGDDMQTFINIAATENNTVIHYDHWEDGYETNFNTPVQPTTEIWGDGNPANGVWPGAPVGTDPAITAGQVIRIRNVVPANPRDPATILYDGGDKIGASRTITISRAQFPVTPGSVIASAVEVRDTRFFDTSYVAPVGTNTPNAGTMFSYTSFFVMASQNNTTVQIDRDNNGVFEQTVLLNQGETVVSATNVLQGGRVVSDKPVQVQLLTGQIAGQYASRSYTLFPTSQLADDYFTPVGQVNDSTPVSIFVFNPNGTAITVNFETRATTGTLGSIPAGTGARFVVPAGPAGSITGTRLFSTGGENFSAVGANDAGNTTYDWGFSLQPVSSLSQLALVALGTGNSNNPPNAPGVANSSPVWITPLAATRVYVDYDGNPATGALSDPFGNLYDVHYDLARLQTQQIRDNSDNDNSGIRLYTTDGTLISTAWGEDANTAPPSAPGFDAGTTVPAVPVPEFYKFSEFATGGDLNNDGYFNAGDIVRYTLRIRHIGTTPINNALITDALPPEVSYVPNTTFIDQGAGALGIADTGTTAFPLDEAGYTIVNLTPGGTTFITFNVTIRSGLPAGTTETTNLSLLTFDIFRLPAVNTIQLRSAIGDTIWHDLDGDGTQDAGEPGIPAVGLTLVWFGPNGVLGGGDDETFTTTTDANGKYTFVDLFSGNFSLTVNPATLPDFVIPTFDLNGIGTANTTLISVGTAEARTDADFGYRGNASIGDRVWFDVNGDGVQQTGAVNEPGIAGATVTLLFGGDDGDLATTADNITYTTITDSTGTYGFTNLFGGDFIGGNPNYRVTVTPPASYSVATFDATAPFDGVSTLQVGAGATRTDQDFGFRGTASFGDFVWQDSNANGVQDLGEPGIPGVSVQLLNSLGTVIAQTTSGVGGAYSFPGLVTGSYSLRFGATVGATTYTRSVADRGGDSTDSDANPTTGQTSLIALADGEANTSVDAGLYLPITLGDRVWFDVDADGTQDAGEPGLAGASLSIVWLGPDGVDGGGDDQTFFATTGVNGIWSVANVPPGNSRVTVTALPAGYSPTFDPDGIATPDTAVISATSGVNRSDIDFGYSGAGSLTGTVWHDLNANSVLNAGEPGIPNVGVTVTWLGFDGGIGGGDDVIYTTTTNAVGVYSVANLPPGNYTVALNPATLPDNFIQTYDLDGTGTANITGLVLAPADDVTNVDFGYRGTSTIGDRVWYDVDGDGVQDNTLGDGFEPGIPGVTVTLLFGGDDGDLNTAADNITYTTTTDINGNYQFLNLFGGDINGGNPNYRVSVTPLAAYPTPTFDADGIVTPNQSSLQLANGASNTVQDFGYRGPATQGIGNFVWEDLNGNGRQDAGEPGIGGATVELWAAGGDATFDTGDDVQLDVTITTAGTGIYSFPNLATGVYQIRFVAPSGFVFAAQNSSVATTATDSDAVQSGATAGRSAPIGIFTPGINNDVDAGLYRPVTLGDRVFLDQNGDGIQQLTEPGITGATVEVTWLGLDGVASGDDQTFSTTTGASGAWSIGSLPPGNHSVLVTPPVAGGFVITDSLDDGVLSAANPVAITAVSGANLTAIDFGFRGTASSGDRIWHDINGDGIQQLGEPGLFGVGVALTWAGLDGSFGTADDAAYSTTTGADGIYSFANLPAGTYRVDVNTSTLPTSAASTDAIDDGVLTPGNSATITLIAGQTRTDVDFGYRGNGTIGDLVWYDVDGDGVRDMGTATEPGIAGATVTLLFGGRDGDLATAADNLTYTTTTAADGTFLFVNMFGGDFNGANPNYRVTVTPPAGFIVQTFDATSPATDSTSTLRLNSGESNLLQDFGYRGTAALGNFVWQDDNGNGVQDGGEPGIDGVTVQLLDAGGNVIAQTLSAGGGLYSFPGLVAGSYSIRFGNSNATLTLVRTPANVGGDDAIDSDADPATGVTGSYLLAAGETNNSVGAGLYQLTSVGDRVWFDADADGTQNGGETGINGVTVILDYAGLDGMFGTGDDQLAVATRITAVDGNYSFANLAPGTYRTRIDTTTLPAGLATPTFDLDGIATADQATFTLVSAQNRTDADFGYRGTGIIGDRVWLDSNGNGVQDAVALEPGLPGVTIDLTWAGGDNTFGNADDVALTTTTDGSGAYSFLNLPAGNFRAVVQTASLPTNVTQTFDLTPPLNHAALRSLAAGENATNVDFGYVGGGSIGDRVWYDVDGNGVQNSAEPGISGATVTLVWGGPDGDLATAADNVTYITTTNANGDYLFIGLPVNGADDPYRVTVAPPAVFTDATFDSDGAATAGTSVLALGAAESNTEQDFGWRGPVEQGLGSFVWEDLNGNGRQDAGEPGIDGVTVELYDATGTNLLAVTTTASGGAYTFPNLIPGSYQVRFGASVGAQTYTRTVANSLVAADATNSDANVLTGFSGPVTVTAGATNNDVDSGLYVPVSLGDRVWFDLNADGVQDVGEPGISGGAITVTWFGPNGNQVYNATTGANGIWSVTDLPPGSYSVASSVPAALGFTTLTDSLDDGVLNATNLAVISTISGVNRSDADFGYVGTGSLGNTVWHDTDADGVRDAGEPGIPGVQIQVVWSGSDGVLGTADDATLVTTTDAVGLWTVGNLPAGSFQVNVLTATLPDQFIPTYDLDGTATANSAARVLAPGEAATDANFGYRGTSSIGDRVWYDVDGDGVQDNTLGDGFEPGIPGVTVTLLFGGDDGDLSTAGDNITYTTVTDANGNYLFSNLFGGDIAGANPNYQVTVSPLAAYPTPTFDADGTGTANQSALQLADGVSSLLQDFGYRGPANQGLGDFVWEDLDGNGRQDAGEPGIGGATVELWAAGPDGNFNTGDDVQLDVTTTAGTGLYSFPNLAAGTYQIRVIAPSGFAFTTQNSALATTTTDSDVAQSGANAGRTGSLLVGAAVDTSIDAGLYVPVSLGDRVWFDTDADGVQDAGEPGIPNATVTITWFGPNGNQTFNTTTDANGLWTVDNLPSGNFSITITDLQPDLVPTFDLDGTATPGVTQISTTSGVDRSDADFGFRGIGIVGDRVFLDVNANGLYDAGEGLDGVSVSISGDLNGDGIPELLTTVTATDGLYQFANLRMSPTGVSYTITIDTATLPSPLINSADPDNSGGTGDSASLFNLLTASPSNTLQDFGYRGPGSIGDTIFLDANNNGLPDAGEGITGVGVTLTADIDGDGTDETFSAVTDASGRYLFANLSVFAPGGAAIDYTITVTAADLPAGVSNSADPDGGGDSVSTFTLDPVNPTDLSQDFGYRGAGVIGDRIFLDFNGNGTFEPGEGLANITLTLAADLNGDGLVETLTAITDADGLYQFTGLPVFQSDGSTPVDYTFTVVAATLPAGVTNSTDPDGGNDNVWNGDLEANPTRTDIDFGYRGTGTLGDRVWIDSDGDGVQGPVALEPGLPGVSFTLTWAGPDGTFGNADDATTSVLGSAAGAYGFANLPPGSYRVDVTGVPANMAATFDADGAATANSAVVVLANGEARTDADFGYAGNSSIGDRVWFDRNRDGVQDPFEPGVPFTLIQLTWSGTDGDLATTADNVTFTTITNLSGQYSFPGLPVIGASQQYRVTVLSVPLNLVPTNDLDSGIVSPDGTTLLVLAPSTVRTDVDFGYSGGSSLAGRVFRDDNNDGLQNGTEPGIAGAVVTLTGVDPFGNVIVDSITGLPYTRTTDANGNYSFTGLVPGVYTLTETQPAAYSDGLDSAGILGGNPGNDVVAGINVGPNQTGTGYTFGERGQSFSGTVYRDDNRDGVKQGSEPGIPGVVIELRDSTGTTLIATTTTDANGNYSFPNLPAGDYRIVEIQPVNYGNSPVGPATIRNVTLPVGGLAGQDFGETLGRIGGTVYLDSNNNGVRDGGEPGLSGVSIQLVGTVPAGVFAITQTTDANGNYLFDNLIPATYRLEESQPAGYFQGANAVGTINGTSNGTLGPVTDWISSIALAAGDVGINYLFGDVQPAGTFISGTVFLDRDQNGLPGGPGEFGIPGVTIELVNASNVVVATVTTGADGSYIFSGVVPGDYTIRETQPAGYGSTTPNLVNVTVPAGGLAGQNFGESLGGLSGSVYFDINRDGTRQAGEPGIPGVLITLTGADAAGTPVNQTTLTDAAGNYQFPGLAAGTYTLTETQPAGYVDGQESTGTAGGTLVPTDTITSIPLGSGTSPSGYDFGDFGVPVTGTVFRDDNKDGTIQVGEPGVPGVTIQLVDAGGNVVGTAITDAIGNYSFPNVPPGNYTLVELQPAGYGSSPSGPFSPDSRPITVSGTPVTAQSFGDILSSFSGSVFVDSNTNGTRDSGEPGIGGVPIRLDSAGPDNTFGTADDVVGFRTTTTNANGDYSFTLLPTGVYRLVEPTQPAPFPDGAEQSGAAGGDTAVNDRITDIPLAAGTDVAGYTFAELSPAAPGTTFLAGTVYLDTNGNGVQDSGESGVPNVLVSVFSGGIIPPSNIFTDANGNYVFTGLVPDLVYTVSESQPSEYASGPENASNVVNVLVSAAGVTGANFGETPSVASGTVYFDRDASGAFNAGDVPLPGVNISIQNVNTNAIISQLTAADGSYSFINLPAGTYRIIEAQPAGYNQGTNTPGAGSVLGGLDTFTVTLDPGAASSGNNFGELGATIGGTVWLDADRDGVLDPGETTGIGGVVITLLDSNGVVVATATTNPDGTYTLPNLAPGNYTLVQTQPAAYGSTTTNTLAVTLTPAGATGLNFGETFATLRGNVFADRNNNGLREATESGLSGVTVSLSGTDVNGNFVNRTAITDANGDYVFTNLPAGTYTTTETQPTAFNDGIDTFGTAGGSLAAPDSIINVPIGAGTTPDGYTFAEVTSSFSGVVYRDFNLNSTFNSTGTNPDTGIPGITITLTGTDTDGRPVNRTVITGADGSYVFDGMGAGTYTITETQPPLPTTLFDGFYDGADNQGTLPPPVGGTPVKNQLSFTALIGQNGTGFNFGELPPADPFGFVFVDLNQNGARDTGEPGIANVAITISGLAFAGTPFERPLVASDIPGGSLTIFTDASGRFEFSPIPPGLYSLTEVQPLGYADGQEQDGDPNGPAATVGNDVISNIVLAPFPIRGPFNFGEILLPAPPAPLPPIDFFPPNDPSKRGFLGSTPTGVDATVPTSPAFTSFNPGVRPTVFASVSQEDGGLVRVFDFAAGNERFRFQPFGDFAGGVRITTADVTGDGIPDIIAVPGSGGGPVVKVFDGNSGAEVRSFFAFEESFRGGLRVAATDLNGDFIADIIVTPDAGGGAVVRAFDGATGAVIANFLALDPDFRGGLRVAAADVNNDGVGDILVTAGVGGGPHVSVYNGATLTTTQSKIGADFFAFDSSLRSGFWISGGDVDGDGFDDVVLGAGDGGAPRVVAYSGQALSTGGGAVPIVSFFAGDSSLRTGARILAADLDGDGRAEIMSAGGLGSLPITYIYDPLTGQLRDAFYALPVTSKGGVSVG